MGPDPSPTSVQTHPEICANPLKSVLYIGGPMHVYCNFLVLLLTEQRTNFSDPHFFGLATPLVLLFN